MTEKDPQDEGRGFRVIDRRSEDRDEPEPASERIGAETEPVVDTAAPGAPLPEEDAFAHFIMSLATSAYMHLGMMAQPGGEQMEKNLPLARQSIDILGMIAAKTQGNLTAQEEALLQQILSELRLHFVNEQKKDCRKKG